MREPTVFWWPGKLKEGVVADMGSTLDLFPTFMALAGVDRPGNRVYDGVDLSPALLGTGASPRGEMIFYRGQKIYAARVGAFKAHFITRPSYGKGQAVEHDPPELYNVETDPSEKYNIAENHAEVIAKIRKAVAKHVASVVPVEDQLAK
jgi:arylsulfatase A-like enzyme